VLHDLPQLWTLDLGPYAYEDLPGLAALAPTLHNLAITGARPSARAPASLSALSSLTRLEIALRPSYNDATAQPLFGQLEWLPGRGGASPLDGCCNLRALVITDDGPRLTFPPALTERLMALRELDLRGVRAPVLDRKLLLTAMPALERLAVPRGALQAGLIARLGRRGRGDVPRFGLRFRARAPAGCDVVVEEVGEGPDAAVPGGAAPAAVPPAPPQLPLLQRMRLCAAPTARGAARRGAAFLVALPDQPAVFMAAFVVVLGLVLALVLPLFPA
jgi:hypothetical protein